MVDFSLKKMRPIGESPKFALSVLTGIGQPLKNEVAAVELQIIFPKGSNT